MIIQTANGSQWDFLLHIRDNEYLHKELSSNEVKGKDKVDPVL
jgi:hypothetical protein